MKSVPICNLQVVANGKNNPQKFHFRLQRNLEAWMLLLERDAPFGNIQLITAKVKCYRQPPWPMPTPWLWEDSNGGTAAWRPVGSCTNPNPFKVKCDLPEESALLILPSEHESQVLGQRLQTMDWTKPSPSVGTSIPLQLWQVPRRRNTESRERASVRAVKLRRQGWGLSRGRKRGLSAVGSL